MDCETYRRLYPKFSALPLAREVWETPEYEAHSEHFQDCDACSDWTMARRVEKRGAKVEDYPCVHIAEKVTEKLDSPLNDPFDDPDVIIWQFDSTGEFGIPIRDGGSSIVVISNCPWCGIPLYPKHK